MGPDPALVLLSYDYPPLEGGISRLCSALVDSLKAAKVPVSVIAADWQRRHGLPVPEVPTTRVPVARPQRELMTWRLLRTLPKETVVITDVWEPEASLAVAAGLRRVVVLAHGNEVLRGTRCVLEGPRSLLRREVLQRAMLVVCNSRYTEGLVREAAPKAHTCVVNPAVDVEARDPYGGQPAARHRLGLALDQMVVLTVSRLDANKGHDLVLRALAGLSPGQRRRIDYLIAGRGAQRAALQRHAEELGIAPHVRFLDFVPDQDLPDLYRSADLFVLCSREDRCRKSVEGFGMVLLEAQAAGVPVIGTRAGGIPDAISDGDGGWLIEPEGVGELTGHLVRLLSDPGEFRRQGNLARARVLRLGAWDAYRDALLAQVGRLL